MLTAKDLITDADLAMLKAAIVGPGEREVYGDPLRTGPQRDFALLLLAGRHAPGLIARLEVAEGLLGDMAEDGKAAELLRRCRRALAEIVNYSVNGRNVMTACAAMQRIATDALALRE